MMKEIIVINGTGGSGKDSFINFVSNYISLMNFSSVDKVKEIARMIGWDGGKTEKDRKFLSDLKVLTAEYNDMPFRSMSEIVDIFRESNEYNVLFLHIREPENIARAVDAFGARTLLIKRNGLMNITSNYSDANVDNYDYDYVIENSGSLEELEISAFDFVRELKNKFYGEVPSSKGSVKVRKKSSLPSISDK